MIPGARARIVAIGAAVIVSLAATPAPAHHVGAYTVRDNAVSANFKQIKFSLQAGKFDVALRLYEEGALRQEMRAQAKRLPAGLDDTVRAALRARDPKTTETALALFFTALSRDLALEASARLADPGASAETRSAAGAKFLDAIWRYWNLVDFAVSERDPKSAVAMRLAFEEAEGSAKRVSTGADPTRLRASLARIADTLADIIQTLSDTKRRQS